MHRYLCLVIIFFVLPLLVIATPTEINVTDIQITSNTEQEHILISFDQSFQETPSLESFETGIVRVTLPQTIFNPKLSHKIVNDRFIQVIRFEKKGTGSVLEIQFANSEFEPIRKINFERDNQYLNIYINKKEALVQPETEPESGIFQEINQKKADRQSTFLESSFLEDSDITTNIIKMLVALFFLLLFLYALLWLYKKFFVSKFSYNKGKYSIQVSASYHISPKQKIVVLEVNDTAFACGVTPSQISVISEISDDSFMKFVSKMDLSEQNSVNFGSLRTQYLESRKQEKEQEKEKDQGKISFSSELIKRVKKLRPLD